MGQGKAVEEEEINIFRLTGLYVLESYILKAKSVIWLIGMLWMASCLKQPGNHVPEIEALIMDPTGNYTPGSDIGIAAMVTDRDGDPLEYYWESDGGLIHDPLQATTVWELYTKAEPYSYESITLTVSDGFESVSRTRTIQVSEGLMMSGHTYFEGTTIPVPGVEVTIGKFSTVSDESGHYAVQYLKEGNTLVKASKAGFETYESVVYVDNPKSTYHIPLSSSTETHLLTGLIKTVDDITYGGLKVVLLNPDGSESELRGVTAENGTFQIATVPDGRRDILIRNSTPGTHFLNDSVIFQIDQDDSGISIDARIKIKRTLISDFYMSQIDQWEFDGVSSDGFYQIGRGQMMSLKEFISIPEDAEDVMLYLNSFVIGGCDMVGRLPSHRVWISNEDSEYLGGISWGGEGNNFSANLSWYPAETPTYLNIYGKFIKLHLELFGENTCVPNPLWRIYQIEFSYYF